MHQEFVTSRGKIVLTNSILFIRTYRFRFWDTVAGKLFLPVVAIVVITWKFIDASTAFEYFLSFVWLAILLRYIFSLYDFLFRRSFAHRIPLNRIVSFEVKPDEIGLETEVILHLKNGRYRQITFRTLEKQHEPLLHIVSSYITSLQLV